MTSPTPSIRDMIISIAEGQDRRATETTTPTPAMVRTLRRAAERERGNICPVVGCHAVAETQLIQAMDRRGFIAWDGPVPRISDRGRAALAKAGVQS